MKVLIAPFGNFEKWKEVRYSYKGRERRGNSTLPLLTEVEDPEKILVVVLDTLGNTWETYSDMRQVIKERSQAFIRSQGVDSAQICVAPGVGEFPNGSFDGKLLDYYNFMLYTFANFLPPKTLEVHLDLSHGINYMPVLTYKALRDLLEILSITQEVRLKAHNSEPVIGSNGKNPRIRKVEDIIVPRFPSAKPIPRQKANIMEGSFTSDMKRKDFYCEEVGVLEKILTKEKRLKLNAFLSSFVYGLPLVYSTFFPNLEELRNDLDHLVDIYFDFCSLDREERHLKRQVAFGTGFEALVKLYFTGKVTHRAKFLKKELSLQELDEVTRAFFRENRRLWVTIQKDWYNIKEKAKIQFSDQQSEWIKIREILPYEGANKFNIRNFLAHSGFEANVSEIKMKEDDRTLTERVILRYAEDKLDTICDGLDKVLTEEYHRS